MNNPHLQHEATVSDLASVLLKNMIVGVPANNINVPATVHTSFFIAEEFMRVLNERYETTAALDEGASQPCHS